MSQKLRALQERKAELVKAATAINQAAEAEDRDLSDEELEAVNGHLSDIEAINGRIDTERKLLEAEKAAAATVFEREPDVRGGKDRREDDPQHGFQSFGDFALAVKNAARRSSPEYDERLKIGAAPTTYGNTGSGEDGGYLIPPGFSSDIREHMTSPNDFLPMTDDIPVQGNSMRFPVDETTPWGTDGIRAYWEAEAAQATQTKPSLKARDLRLHKLFALVPVTDELVSDASALSAYLPRKAGQSINFKANDALFNGTGAGQPLGILNSDALVTVAKETSQTAATIVANNVAKMYARLTPDAKSTAVWVVHHTAFPQLMTLSIGNQPVWQPDFRQAPGGTLLGRPVYEHQSLVELGTKNDIVLADWSKYVTIRKELQTATSLHLWFDYDVMAFRAIFRIDGQPWLREAVSPKNGSSKQSHYVTLATRS